MAGIKNYSTSAASNNNAPPDGWPEGQAPSTVNNTGRQMMADIRSFYEAPDYVDLGHTPTYASSASFRLSGDLTSYYSRNRPIYCTDTSSIYGYVISSTYSNPNTTITISPDSGFLTSALSAIAVSLNDPAKPRTRLNNIIDVTGYGAIGDGTTDDTAAILKALVALKNYGGILYFPPGTYLVGTSATANVFAIDNTWLKSVVILGSGRKTSIIKCNTKSYNLFYLANPGGSWTFRDIGMLGIWESADDITYNYNNAVRGTYGDGHRIENCEMSYFGYGGLQFTDTVNLVAEGNNIHHSGWEGILLSAGCYRCSITNNTFLQNKWHVDINGYEIDIIGNKFMTTRAVYETWGITIELNNTSWTVKRINVLDNIFYDVGDYGINLAGYSDTYQITDVVIAGNTVSINETNDTRLGIGIRLKDCADVAIKSNIIRDCTSSNATVNNGVAILFRGNTLVNRVSISGNIIENNETGLLTASGGDVTITDIDFIGNKVTNTTTAISLAASAGSSATTGFYCENNIIVGSTTFYSFGGVTPTASFFGKNFLRTVTTEATGAGTPTSIIEHRTADGSIIYGAFSDTGGGISLASLSNGPSGVIRIPNITTTQRNALTAKKGDLVYNTSLDTYEVYDGAWKTVTIS